ncbi:MAG: SDR family oxidoreductase [Saprospiraceae bacterium]|nr:SDR family oxidoreductase [Saprospiraceae bacterium]
MSKKAALVTGSAIRLGKAIAIALAKDGYDIALHYNSSASAAEETKAEIQSLGVQCEAFQLNLRKADDMPDFVKDVVIRFPHLSVLVNSASAYTQATIENTTTAIFDQQFDVNIKAPFFLTQIFANTVSKGNVINIIDNKMAFNQNNYAAYLLAKKTLVSFTKMAAIEYAPSVRVNGLAPGVVLPAGTRSPEYMEWRIQGIPLKMQGTTQHITDGILSLLQNTFVTGQILTVDGGESITNTGKNAGDFDQSKI